MRRILFMVIALFSSIAVAQDVTTYIPVKAPALIPIVITESHRLLPALSEDYYFGSLIEVESCIGLKHSKCWSPTSELKTARERGAGLGQLTVAYKADGTVRFDALAGLQKKYNSELKELSWNNILERPDLQVRSMVLLTKDNYLSLSMIKDPVERLGMTDAAYNGGLGGLRNERTACGLTAGCDPNKWFGNVEKRCLKSKKPLYGTRSPCDINREHVTATIKIRLAKYQKEFDKHR